MSNAKEKDSARSLDDLSPRIVMPYALYIPAFDPYGSPHYKEPYRRYATKAHRSAAIKGLYVKDVVLYTYNFDLEQWEKE